MTTLIPEAPNGEASLRRSAGLLLRVVRMRAGLDQESLARRLKVSQSRISRWERGLSLPEAEQAADWLAACAVDADTAQAALGLLELARAEGPAAAAVGMHRLLLGQLSGQPLPAPGPDELPPPLPAEPPAQSPPAGSGKKPADGALEDQHDKPAERPDAAGAGQPGGRSDYGRAAAALLAAPLPAGTPSYDTTVPYFAHVAAGLGELQAPRFHPRAQIPVPADVLRRDSGAYALKVSGDSMLPQLASGDIVVVSPRAPLSPGCIVAARVDPDGDVVKQYRLLPDGRVQLIPLNPAYPMITLRASLDSLSALAASGRPLPPDALELEGAEGQLWGRVIMLLREL